MSLVQKIFRHPKFYWLVSLVGLVGIIVLVVLWKLGIDVETLRASWKSSRAYLQEHEWALFLALAFLPGFAVPVSPLLLLAGAVWGATLKACVLTVLALAVNMSWTYWVAAYPARKFIERLLLSTSVKIPDLPKNDHVRLVLIFRLTPGIPFFIHNYVLGFVRTPFWIYLPMSVLLGGAVSIGILLTGGAILEGKAGMAITGISLIIVGVLVTRWLRGRLEKRKMAELEKSSDTGNATEDLPVKEVLEIPSTEETP
ncbi:MAG: TVP38/TMEM64 family protein [Verrucomicrobiales bacterium]|nr:VTT domain-containing protein [Verrucomicrobiae bacterium]